ncbi:MAG: phosphoribosylglycinamide formyltransferase, partial [Proteobacteria bacterium]|nr:phosphoribosylglycinamide formyltransferase [Pseudomonadota bacterium]
MSAPRRLRVAVLVSGGGTNLQAILDAAQSGRIDVEVALVISNRAQARGLERARQAGVPALVISARDHGGREAFEQALIDALRAQQVEWVVLAGFMRLLSGTFLAAFPQRVINIHPSLLPAFPGLEA